MSLLLAVLLLWVLGGGATLFVAVYKALKNWSPGMMRRVVTLAIIWVVVFAGLAYAYMQQNPA